MEIRKLQKIKGGSYTLSIPKRWVEKKRLKSGQQMVMLEEDDGSLSVYSMTKTSNRGFTVTLLLEAFPDLEALEYNIATYYIQGADRIDVISKDIIPATKKRKLKLLRLAMPGIEVSEARANRISFHVLIDPTAFHLETLLNKTCAFSMQLQEDAVKSMVNWDFPLAREVIERSGEALRHYRLTIRQVALASINKSVAREIGVRSCQECVTFALIARDLSRLVYHCSQIAGHVLSLEKKRNVSKRALRLIEKLSESTKDMQKNAVESFLRKDAKLAVRVFRQMKKVRELEGDLLKEIMTKIEDVDTAVTTGLIGLDLRRIAGYSVAVADDSMNRVLTPKSALHREPAPGIQKSNIR